MPDKLILHRIRLSLSPAYRNTVQTQHSQSQPSFILDFKTGNCCHRTERFGVKEDQVELKSSVELLHEGNGSEVQAELFRLTEGQVLIKLASGSGSNTIQLTNGQQPVATLNFQTQRKQLGAKPFITFTYISCILPNLTSIKDRYLQFETQDHKHRSSITKTLSFAWQEPIRVYMEKEERVSIRLVDVDGEKTHEIKELASDFFKVKSGGLKTFILDRFNFPRGSVVFRYTSQNLYSEQEYKANAEAQLKKNQVIKSVRIQNVIGFLKKPADNLKLRVNAGSNMLFSQVHQEETKKFSFDINNYIYSQNNQKLCSFALMSGCTMIGHAHLGPNLNGIFTTKLQLLSPENDQEIGALIVKFDIQEISSNSVTLTEIKAKLDSHQQQEGKVFVGMKIGGYYCRSEFVEESSNMEFRKQMNLRFTEQKQMVCLLKNQNNGILAKGMIALGQGNGSERQEVRLVGEGWSGLLQFKCQMIRPKETKEKTKMKVQQQKIQILDKAVFKQEVKEPAKISKPKQLTQGEPNKVNKSTKKGTYRKRSVTCRQNKQKLTSLRQKMIISVYEDALALPKPKKSELSKQGYRRKAQVPTEQTQAKGILPKIGRASIPNKSSKWATSRGK